MCGGQRLSLYFQQRGGVMVFQRQQKPWCSSSIFMPSTYIKPASQSTCGAPSPCSLLNCQPVAHLLHRNSLLVNPTAFLLHSSCLLVNLQFVEWSTCGAPTPQNFIGQPNGISSPFNLFIGQPAVHLLHIICWMVNLWRTYRTSLLVNQTAFLLRSTCLLVNLRRTFFI